MSFISAVTTMIENAPAEIATVEADITIVEGYINDLKAAATTPVGQKIITALDNLLHITPTPGASLVLEPKTGTKTS